MTFSNPLFYLIFLPLALLGFQLFGMLGRRGAVGFLAFMSLIFYAKWNPRFLALLIGSVVVNYLFSVAIDRNKQRAAAQQFWLVAGIAVNLAALCYFKYLFPLLKFLFHHGVLHGDWGTVILPLGISFFTFTQIAYLVDLKQGVAERQGLLSYTLFVTFFPHLIAGPIIHHKEMMPQFSQERRYRLNLADLSLGLTWFTMGLFKKVMIADRISGVADAFFQQPYGASFSAAWLGALTYSMQLYFDFSGYSDMAVGLARMFSIHFPLNFDSPYKASSILDFWQRWHMTLTRYIMEYLYSPMQFWVSRRRMEQGKKISRKAMATPAGFISMVALPTLLTMFITGIWHGAGLQFLVFGLMHGGYLTLNHAWRIFVPVESRLRKILSGPVSVAVTYGAVVMSEVMFRANSFHDALASYKDMSGMHGLGAGWPMAESVIMVGLFAVVWLLPNTQEILGEARRDDQGNWSLFAVVRWNPTLAWWLVTSATFTLSMFYSMANTEFLYFQF